MPRFSKNKTNYIDWQAFLPTLEHWRLDENKDICEKCKEVKEELSLTEFTELFFSYDEKFCIAGYPANPKDIKKEAQHKWIVSPQRLKTDLNLLKELNEYNRKGGIYILGDLFSGEPFNKLCRSRTVFIAEARAWRNSDFENLDAGEKMHFSSLTDKGLKHLLLDKCVVRPNLRIETLESVIGFWIVNNTYSSKTTFFKDRLEKDSGVNKVMQLGECVTPLPHFNQVNYNKKMEDFEFVPVKIHTPKLCICNKGSWMRFFAAKRR